jgi:hypothetical protein
VLTAERVSNVAFTPFQQWKERQSDSETMQWWAALFADGAEDSKAKQ